ncbi:MAG: hypothetical protein ACOYMF_17430 [Bacteroidales bacterium]
MPINKLERPVKPHYNRFRILHSLRKFNGDVVIYNLDDRMEDKAYSRIHNIMHAMSADGLITYSRNINGEGNYMLSRITQAGREYIFNRTINLIIVIASIIAAITGLVTVFR